MSEVEQSINDNTNYVSGFKTLEGVEPPKKQKAKPKREVIMTWGKYKGKFVKDIIVFDEKYAKWLYKQDYINKFEDIYRLLDENFKFQ